MGLTLVNFRYKRKDEGGDVFLPTVGPPVVQNCGLLRLTVNHLPRLGDPRGVSNVPVRTVVEEVQVVL